jgi:hypothetical protein
MKSLSCFNCEGGFYRECVLPYKTFDADNKDMIILDVPHYVCNNCSHICFGLKALKLIEESITDVGVKYHH